MAKSGTSFLRHNPAPGPFFGSGASFFLSPFEVYTTDMRTAWVLQGLGFLILGVAVYFAVENSEQPSLTSPQASFTSANTQPMNDIIIRSPAFQNEHPVPSKYTCDGENISPPLAFDNIPDKTASLVLIIEDPDVPTHIREDGMWNHWILFNIPPETGRIGEGEQPMGTRGLTTKGELLYGGPCPPDREHRYFFKVYALDTILKLPEGSTKEEVLENMKGHILSTGELIGTYARQ